MMTDQLNQPSGENAILPTGETVDTADTVDTVGIVDTTP